MKYSIEELCNIVNEKILTDKSLMSADSRISNGLSVRRIRDYLSKGMISQTEGTGREKFFNESHDEQLVELRKLQLSGFSEKLIRSSYGLDKVNYSSSGNSGNNGDCDLTISKDVTNPQSTALDFLKGLSPQNNNEVKGQTLNSGVLFGVANSIQEAKSSISRGVNQTQNNIKQFSDKMVSGSIGISSSLYQTSSKSFTEHGLDVEGKIFLKLDNSIAMEEQIEIIKLVKQSLK